jgi:hypothetical protein
MAKVEFSLMGDEEMARKLLALAEEFPKICARALGRRGEGIMTVSKETFVPVKDGILRSTGHVDEPKIEGHDISVELKYGGPAAPYALKQHEELSYHHDIGEAKYLEKPMFQAASSLAEQLASDIKDELGP